MKMVRRAIAWFLYGASVDFADHERRILQAVADALPERDSKILRRHMEAVRSVQQNLEGRIVLITIAAVGATLGSLDGKTVLAVASLKHHGKKIRVRVVCWRGKLHTLESNYPLHSLQDGAFEILEVKRGDDGGQDVSEIIDRHEHGSDAPQ